ncbi:MAG: hypothetical protein GX096_03165 [Clostridiales bacterium]|nr:hypothetical protein [Clostridiales bacterium]
MDDIITKITTDKRGATVVINEEITLWFGRSYWYERGLKEGEAVDLAELREWLLPRQYNSALSYAVSLLALKARSTSEIRKKLIQRLYMDETVEMVLYKLEKEKLVDDEAFARDFAASKSRKQMGKRRIVQELWMKGITGEAAQQAIDELDEDEKDEQATALAMKLVRKYQNEEPRKAMQKALAAMARRGYDYEDSKNALSAAIHKIDAEDEDDDDESGE